MMQMPAEPSNPIVFVDPRKVGWQAALLIVGGGLLVLLGLFSFMLILINPDPHRGSAMPGVYGGLAVVPIFMFTRAWILLSRTVRVTVETQGLRIEGSVGGRVIPWAQIAELARKQETPLWEHRKLHTLDLLNDKGKRIAQLNERIEGFPELVAMIEQRSSRARGTSTLDAGREAQRVAREDRKTRWLLGVGGGLLTALFGFVTVSSVNDYTTEKKFADEGQRTLAAIDRHYLFNGTPRVEYTLTDQFGHTFTDDVMLERWAWDALDGADRIEVVYLPARPDRNRPVNGFVDPQPYPLALMIPAGFAAMLFSSLACLIGIVGIKGINRENGAWRFKRFGEPDTTKDVLQIAEDHRSIPDGSVDETIEVVALDDETDSTGPAIPPTPPARPGLTVIGILNLAIGLLGMGWHLLRLCLFALLGGKQFELESGTFEIPPPEALLYIDAGVSAVLSLLLAVSAIGIFRRRLWGLRCALAAVIGKLLVLAVSLVALVIAFPANEVGEGAEHGGAVFAGWLGGLTLLLVTGIYPAVVLFTLGRRSARASFHS